MMKISGFTIVRNAIKYQYPALESIQSILPICDEFVVNVGNSEDDTLALIKSLQSPKIRIIQNTWDMSMGKEVLSYQTNLALQECRGTWAFYLQSDEVIHEKDLHKLNWLTSNWEKDESVDVFRFNWLHFYGSYFRYRVDHGWYQKQDRIIRNNGQIVSMGDAWGFQRKDNQPLKRANARCLLYHYGWVHSPQIMKDRRENAENIGFVKLSEDEKRHPYDYGDLNRLPVYFGNHPKVMQERIAQHPLSQSDLTNIKRKYWWHPGLLFKLRYKTGRRVKEKLS